MKILNMKKDEPLLPKTEPRASPVKVKASSVKENPGKVRVELKRTGFGFWESLTFGFKFGFGFALGFVLFTYLKECLYALFIYIASQQ